MKKLFAILMILCACQLAQAQVAFPRQDVHYNVLYHWGFVNVDIARGVVSVQSDGKQFSATLDGTSIPWEGKIICVSDTLKANVGANNGTPVENVTYQSGWYRHVPVSQFRSATYNPDDPAYYKNIHGGGTLDASNSSMEAITITSDMLGIYYMAHVINFDSMSAGATYRYNISGPFANEVAITYEGAGTYTVNGDTYPTYNISFEYSYGSSLSKFPVECKISKTTLTPLYFGADLPVGKVEMNYAPD